VLEYLQQCLLGLFLTSLEHPVYRYILQHYRAVVPEFLF
jgi:hypothetical protein